MWLRAKKRLLTAAGSLALAVTGGHVSGQDLAASFIKSGVADANKLVNAYLSTTMKGIGQSMNDGWHNTAKPLGKWGFELRMNVGIGFVPEADRTYNFYNIGLNTDRSTPYLALEPGANPNQPTIYGEPDPNPDKVQVRVSYASFDTMITSFSMPTGSGIHISPSVPMIQGGIGIPLNTELDFRFFPETKLFENYRIGLYGIGFKHDMVQWLPAYSRLGLTDRRRPFDWSLFGGYTWIRASYGDGPLLTPDSNAYNPDPNGVYASQVIAFSGTAYTLGTIVSKEFGARSVSVTPFVGVNYAWSSVTLQFKGDYPLVVPNDQYSASHPQLAKVQYVSNPVIFENVMDNFRTNIGLRVKLTIVTLSAQYNIGKYNTMSFGIAFNVQSLKPVEI